LNISYSTLRRWDESWKLESIRIWTTHRKYNLDDIQKVINSNYKEEKSNNKFKFIDLFAWIGGFHVAFHNLWWKCVSSCEIDKNARNTYEFNFKPKNKELFDNWYFFEDVTKLKWDEVLDHDILCWWFPCQAFSIAWNQKWFEDDRWNLFFDVARIVKKKKPKVVFLENVKNLTSHDKWNTFNVILDTLKNLWYHVKFQVLNTYEYWNVPQNRERIYIVWFKDKKSYNNFEFPWKINLDKKITDLLEKNVENTFYYNWKPLYDRIKDDVTNKNTAYQWRRQYVRENKKWLVPTLTANMWTWWHNVPIILVDDWIRKLTPKECIRFQWYPENYKFPSISNWQQYKQAWNSVSVPVIQRIWENIIKSLWI
jgi:DNA (cytosine-5)-methyltransferase 1